MTVISKADEWRVFPHQTHDGRPIVVRSRLGEPSVRQFAEANFMARMRCVLPRDQVNEDGMPVSTASMDEWEDKLLAGLGDTTSVHEVAVVTGAGVRDLFFAATDRDELLTAVSDVEGNFTFELQLAQVDSQRDALLNSLTPPE